MQLLKLLFKYTNQQISFYIFIIYIITFFSSCKNEKIETIKFDLENDNLIPAIEIKSIIKLETSDSCLIGDISKISFTPQSIYILDKMITQSLFQFNMNGEFVAKTLRGRGPGEVSAPWDFIINKKNQSIQLWESTNSRMIEFDYNLKYINCIIYRFNYPKKFHISNKS